jgi:hypothetical protein
MGVKTRRRALERHESIGQRNRADLYFLAEGTERFKQRFCTFSKTEYLASQVSFRVGSRKKQVKALEWNAALV